MRLRFAVALCCITAGTVYCQRGPAPYYEDTNNVPVSPEVHVPIGPSRFDSSRPRASEVEVRRWGPTSLFIVPGGEKAVIEERRVPHGTVHVEFYDSAPFRALRIAAIESR